MEEKNWQFPGVVSQVLLGHESFQQYLFRRNKAPSATYIYIVRLRNTQPNTQYSTRCTESLAGQAFIGSSWKTLCRRMSRPSYAVPWVPILRDWKQVEYWRKRNVFRRPFLWRLGILWHGKRMTRGTVRHRGRIKNRDWLVSRTESWSDGGRTSTKNSFFFYHDVLFSK